jgi:hypothetical protein
MATHSFAFKFYKVDFDEHWTFSSLTDQIFKYTVVGNTKTPAIVLVHYELTSGLVHTAKIECTQGISAFIHRDVIHFNGKEGNIKIKTSKEDSDH